MRSNPTETLRGWGLQQPEADQDWSPVLNGAYGLQNLLEEVATQSQLVGSEIFALVARVDISTLISQELEQIGKSLNENAAITYMRNLFGEPQDGAFGALDVYMQLAGEEIDWQGNTKKDARLAQEHIQSKVNDILMHLQRTFVAKLAEIQAEIERREVMLEGADQATQEHKVELQPLFDEKRKPLDTKLMSLRAERAELSQTSKAVFYMAQQLSQGVEQSIRPILETPVGPTQLQPELAA